MLELKDIRKNYETSTETVEALKGISIKFRENEECLKDRNNTSKNG